MVDIFKDFYIIEARAFEWHVVIQKMIRRVHKDEIPEGAASLVSGQDGQQIYYLKRDEFPIEAIAHATGRSEEELKEPRVIRLFPLDTKKYPEPTVPDIGLDV